MNSITLTGTVSVSGDGQDYTPDPCQILYQQDNEQTVGCQGAGSILELLLGFMGVKIPPSKVSDNYNTTISVKPRDANTSLHLSITHGTLGDPKYKTKKKSVRVSVSIEDFSKSGDKYSVDLEGKLELVDSDVLLSAAWVGSPVNENLDVVAPNPILRVRDHLLESTSPAYGTVVINYNETTIDYDVIIPPRDVDSGFYDSHVVVEADGCVGNPYFYKIKPFGCYEDGMRLRLDPDILDDERPPDIEGDYEGPDDGPPDPPSGGNDEDCEYCLCTLVLKRESVPGICKGAEDPNSCRSGPAHKAC